MIITVPEDASTDDISFELEFVFIDDHLEKPAETSVSVLIRLVSKEQVKEFNFQQTKKDVVKRENE